jgi:hypothetical protein
LSVNIDPDPPSIEHSQRSDWWGDIAREPAKVDAIVDFIEEIIATVATAEQAAPRARLQEDVQLCSEFGRGIVPLALMIASSASLEKNRARVFISRTRQVLTEEVRAALDLVGETLLMVDDKDIQASGTIATSVLVQRVLPEAMAASDSVLHSLFELLDRQYQERLMRHSDIFAPLRHIEKSANLSDLPRLLSEISEALEDLACDRDVFLDNPVELVAKAPEVVEAPEDALNRARLQSGADLPPLSNELEQIAALQEALGWTRDQALAFATHLYERKVLDSRSKIGLSVAAIAGVIGDLNASLNTKVRDVQINEEMGASAPYSYDVEQGALVLNVRYRGALTARMVRAEQEVILEEAKQGEADREATLLAEAIERYEKARAESRRDLLPTEEEVVEVEGLAEDLGISQTAAYDTIACLYGARRVTFSRGETEGLSVRGLRELIRGVLEPGAVSAIAADAEADGLIPFSFDRESGTLTLHSAFRGLSDSTLRWSAEERSVEALPLVEPDEERLSEYEDPQKPGSMATESNMERFIEEFQLAGEFARDSYEIMVEDCPGMRDAISIQTLRVIVATLNARLEGSSKIDLVTGWSREIPGTNRPDNASIGWLTVHTEEGTSLKMLTFNFEYGAGKAELPPFSDELLLQWCRHCRVK